MRMLISPQGSVDKPAARGDARAAMVSGARSVCPGCPSRRRGALRSSQRRNLGRRSDSLAQRPKGSLRDLAGNPIGRWAVRHGNVDQLAAIQSNDDAERFRRAPDWVHPSRMPGPDHCLRRGASAPDSALLRELLQQSSDAPVTQQRRAGASSDSAPWRPKVTSCSRWTTSPIRPNLVFGTDRSRGAPAPIRRLKVQPELRRLPHSIVLRRARPAACFE